MEYNFKVGDRVLIKKGESDSSQKIDGNIATITRLGGDYCYLDLKKEDGEFHCVYYKELTSVSNNSSLEETMEKKVLRVLIVNKKTGKTIKDEAVIAENEQQAILKAFGVKEAENTFIKVEEAGSFIENKPVEAVIIKEAKN